MLSPDQRHALDVDHIGADISPDDPDALFYLVDRCSVQIELELSSLVTAQIEAGALSYQQARFVDVIA